jgi:hypothetical protein
VVFTVPWPRRWLLARDADLLREVVETMRSEVTRWLRRHGVRGLDGREGEPGSVSVIQRFGSTLALNVHMHMLLLDGLFVADGRGAPVWRRARRWRQMEVDGLVVRVAAEVERLLARRGHGPNDPLEVDPDDALADLQEAAVAGRSASSNRRAQRVHWVGGQNARSRRCARAVTGTRCTPGWCSGRGIGPGSAGSRSTCFGPRW